MTSGIGRFAVSVALLALPVVLPTPATPALPPFLTSWSLQPGIISGDPHSVAVDNTGHVYVVNSVNSRIEKYTDSGTFLTMWGSAGNGNGQFNALYGVAADGFGHVYAVDAFNHRIQKFTDSGGYISQWGGLGGIYVTDVALCRVQVFDSTGTYVAQWGGVGTGLGQFTGPWGIAVSAGGDVYVSDEGSSCRIEKFTSSGGFVAKWDTCYTNNLDTQDCGISGLAVGPDNNVFACSPGCNMIKDFTPTGGLVFRSGTTLASVDCEPGIFSTPYGVAVDPLGNFYVASTGSHCIQKFGPGGSTPAHSTSWGQLKVLYR